MEKTKDKHGFTKSRFSLRLFVKLVLTVMLCSYAFYRCSLRAFATTLTPEQTAALFGSSFVAHYYDTSHNDLAMTGHLIGTSESINGSPGLFVSGTLQNNNTAQTLANYYSGKNWILYGITFDNVASSYEGFPDSLITIVFDNLGLSGISASTFNFGFVNARSGLPSPDREASNYYLWSRINKSSALFYTSDSLYTKYTMYESSTTPYITFSGLSQSFGVSPNNDFFGFSAFNPQDVLSSASETFDLNKIQLEFRSPLQVQNASHSIRIPGGTTGSYLVNNYYVLLVMCPEIGGYTPPVVTTAPPQTTPQTTTQTMTYGTAQTQKPAETVDLSHLESGVAAIVSEAQEANNNLEWIGENIYIGVNDLAYICNKLDAIYNKMWNAGEIPLNAGFEPPHFDDLHDFAVSALQTRNPAVSHAVTTYDMRQGFSAFFDIGGSLAGSPLLAPFILVSVVGLAMAVLSFVLFRGH